MIQSKITLSSYRKSVYSDGHIRLILNIFNDFRHLDINFDALSENEVQIEKF